MMESPIGKTSESLHADKRICQKGFYVQYISQPSQNVEAGSAMAV